MKHLLRFVGSMIFLGFIAVKCWGVSFATWSWWWLLLPMMPWLALVVAHFGL